MKARKLIVGLIACAIFSIAAAPAFAGAITLVTVDENGHGNINGDRLSFSLTNDPGPGGLTNVLTYSLPFAGTQGDVIIFGNGQGIEDIVRFNGGTLVFYSSPFDGRGFDSLADTPSAPGAFYTHPVTQLEVNGTVFYTPSPGQPGSTDFPLTYRLISSSPEPSSVALMMLGLAFVGVMYRRRSAV